MRKIVGLLFLMICCLDVAFSQNSSAIISFDDPDMIALLEDLLAKQNISSHIEEVIDCDDEPYPCDILASCTDVDFTYACSCPEGLVGSFDEDLVHTCKENTTSEDCAGGCSLNASCVKTDDGSFDCVCDKGFVGNGNVCFENEDDCVLPFLPVCSGINDTLSCQYAAISSTNAEEVYDSFRYFFEIPDSVKAEICDLAAGNKTEERHLFHSSSAGDSTQLCDIEVGVTYRRLGFLDTLGQIPIEIYHFENNFQWFDVRKCEEKHDGKSPLGCVQRFLQQKAVTIEKIGDNFHFDVKQVYFESGCEVDLFN